MTRGRVFAAWSAVAVVALAGCAGTDVVALEELAVEMDAYDGETVVTHGMVVEFDADDGALERHFVVQDVEDNRVRLVPDEAAEAHVGSMVEVEGRFEFDPQAGRVLHVEEILPAG